MTSPAYDCDNCGMTSPRPHFPDPPCERGLCSECWLAGYGLAVPTNAPSTDDDGALMERQSEAFAAGGMDAYNEVR